MYVIIKNSKKLILGVDRVMDEAFTTSIDSIEKIFLKKGKQNLIGRYKKIFSDDRKDMEKVDNFNEYMRMHVFYSNELNQKILEMLNDKTNGEKYFNNLVCILELLDFLHAEQNSDDYNRRINFIKNSDKDELIEAIKNFVPTENDHMVVLENKNGERFETPGIQICASFTVFEDETSILSCSPDNTCQSDKAYKGQYYYKILEDWTDLGTLFKSLQDVVHQKKWECALKNIGITKDDIENLLSGERRDLYNNARILTEQDKNEIQFFNIAVRGKGSGDRCDIDNKKHDLFSLFNKKLPFFSQGLSRYHIGGTAREAINYLFDKVSYRLNSPYEEGYKNYDSVLNDHGKQITKRVLKLFLDENVYNVIEKDGNIRVEEDIRVDKNFVNTDEKILTYIKKMNLETRKELEAYVDEFIGNLKKIMSENENCIFASNEMYTDTENKKSRIDREIDEMIEKICAEAGEKNYLKDHDSFVFLVKAAVKKRFLGYFSNIDNNSPERNSVSSSTKIQSEYNCYKDDFFAGIKTELMSGLRDNSLYADLKYFDYEKANLAKSATLNNFEDEFDKFKSEMEKAFENKLPETKEEFEKIFEKVTCDKLIDFMKSAMEIEIDEDFLKNVLSSFLYTYIESIYGSAGQANPQKFLSDMRSIFFADYSGRKFVDHLEKYLRNICNEAEKMLPDCFYDYDSNRLKNHNKPFSPLNYIQTFLYAPLFPDKIVNMSADNCEKLVRNMENARNIIESGSDAKFNQLYEKMRQIRNQNPKLTYPKIFLDILLDGVNINLTQKEKLDICRAARDFTNNNLDQNMKEHVTQSNLVKIKKGNEFYKKKSGIVVVPAVNIFANGTFDKLLSRNIWSKKYTLGLAYYFDIGWSYLWLYKTIGFRILFRVCLILFFLPLILFHGILYIIYFCKVGYALFKANGDYIRRFKDPETIRKGIAEYNELQQWKQKIKEENKNNNIIVDSKQNNLIKINSGVKNDINNKIDNNIIDTSSEGKNISSLSGSNDDLNLINDF